MSRRSLAWCWLLAGCVPPLATTPVDVGSTPLPASSTSQAAATRLAELQPLYFYGWDEEVIVPLEPRRSMLPFWTQTPWPDGVLVQAGRSGPAPAMGDRLAVVHAKGEVTIVVVTDQTCPPTAIDCLGCDMRWAARLSGSPIDPDTIEAIVGPLGPDPIELARVPPLAPLTSGIRVTGDGVTLVEEVICSGDAWFRRDCVSSAAFVLEDRVRTLATNTSTLAPRSGPQIFSVLALPDTYVLVYEGSSIGGKDQVVIGQWGSLPAMPITDASYWLIGPTGVVGRIRFGSPHRAEHCSFWSNPCWSTQVTTLAPRSEVWLAIGPITDASPATETITRAEQSSKDEHFELQIGNATQPWVAVHSRVFGCVAEDEDDSDFGSCTETLLEAEGTTTRTVTFLSSWHHSRPESICIESRAP